LLQTHFPSGQWVGVDSIARHEQVTKFKRWFTHQRRMTLDNHAIKRRNALGNRFVVFRRDGARVEEAAAVVQFDLA